ncbi:sushi, nidogen and EGF-like domain-containing protein 1 isoform X2 [Patiria miniata]|uniref:Uncharacterized protein n=1 Tax=Patiria miniata TaxID=46514 RepID=A0A913ZJJ1_PATMI|nr:sushi, nidogen and EGF-like domain-containing protein 1 isoform X2 [Patiria miniata]
MSSSDYRKVTMMMDNPSYDGFLDGRGDRRPHHRMKPFVLVTLLLLAVVGVAVALAVILTGNKPNLEVPEAVTILGSLHISNREYQETYADKTTKEFASLEKEVTDAMDRLYNKSLFRNIYVGSSVSGIRKGSVVVDFAIHLEIPKILFDLKKDKDKQVSAPEYNEAYVHLVKAIDGNALGEFTIIEFSLSFDSESLSFDAITLPPVSRTVEQAGQLVPTTASNPLPKDACNDNPCSNGGTCVLQPDTDPYFSCQCPEGSTGDLCQNAQQSLCDAHPCLNNSTCEGGLHYYRCICAAGYAGESCETMQISLCESNPCQHGGTCRGDTYFFNCACASGWGGRFCEYVAPSNPCNSNPCQHGGQCWFSTVAGQEQYTCICPPGYEGKNCGISKNTQCIDIPILQCCPFLPYNQTVSPNPFQLTETHDELMEFFELSYHFLTPSCHPDAQRVLCTILNPQCPEIDTTGQSGDDLTTLLDFQLPCRSVCREVHDSCLSNLPSQLRREFEVFGNFCYSLPESKEESVCFQSSRQETPYEEPVGCRSSPCENGGACLELNDIIRCRCPRGYGGQTCAYELPSPCSPSPCLNGGICKVGRDSLIPRFTCECPAPYVPPYCDSGQ